MELFWQVFKFSFIQKIKTRSFFLTTVITILFLSSIAWIPKLYNSLVDDNNKKVVIIDEIGYIKQSINIIKKQVIKHYDVQIVSPVDVSKNKKLLNRDKIDCIIWYKKKDGLPFLELMINGEKNLPFLNGLITYLRTQYTLTEMQLLNIPQNIQNQLTYQVEYKIKDISDRSKEKSNMYAPIYIMSFLLYILIAIYGSNVAISIAGEKSSRIKEILITKVKPIYLLYGKILGVGFAGLLQFIIILVGTYSIILMSTDGQEIELFSFKFDPTKLSIDTALFLIFFFILGYIFYAALFAATGSLVSRSEDVNQANLPVSIIIMSAMILAILSMTDPTGKLAVFGSYIPFFTPFLMFVRVGMVNLTIVQILVPIIIMLISTACVVWLSSKVYQIGVLYYGQPPKITKVLKAIISNKQNKNLNYHI
ncbi:hypothetical protein ABH20_17135 [Geobacillus sp. T6]|uniref:ABC transporter permease n=1 Tax=Geobacillus TaxID=129337 RepID=UPI00064ABD31|nr:ABC transporter permease [Geobacillus sp. T6]KLR72294.1 hypothetical protein ABH20_17135 [Geobacillus sp. T6]